LNCLSLKSLWTCGMMKTTLFDFCITDSWEFLGEVPYVGPAWSIPLTKFPISWCTQEAAKCCWILPLVGAVLSFFPAPVPVGLASPSSCMGSLCSTVPLTQWTAKLHIALLQS
jgi:hypothetical protein